MPESDSGSPSPSPTPVQPPTSYIWIWVILGVLAFILLALMIIAIIYFTKYHRESTYRISDRTIYSDYT